MNKSNSPIQFEASPEMYGLRLDKALSLHPSIQTRNRAETLIDNSKVVVNGKSPKASQKIVPGDQIIVELEAPPSLEIRPMKLALEVLFEDNDLIVINKPAGLVVHPAAGHRDDTLVNALMAHTSDLSMKFGDQRPGIVHRLDKDTSGVLVVAKNDEAHLGLASQFKDRSIHRIYFAACFGRPALQNGTISTYIARHPSNRKKFASVLGEDRKIIRSQLEAPQPGKWSVTHYQTLQSLPSGLCLLRLKLETGRTHQIRVHLSESGCPILGDILYGAGRKLSSLKNSSAKQLLQTLPRFTLHAAELGFTHPKTKQKLDFSSPWPDDVRGQLTMLGFKLAL